MKDTVAQRKKKIYMKPAPTESYIQILAPDWVSNKVTWYTIVQKKLLKSNEFAVLVRKELY